MALFSFSGQTHRTLWIDLRADYESGSGIRMINVLAAARSQSDPVSWHNRLAVDLAGPGATKTEIRPRRRRDFSQLNFAYINAKPSPQIEFHIANQARPVIGDSRCRRFFRLSSLVAGGGSFRKSTPTGSKGLLGRSAPASRQRPEECSSTYGSRTVLVIVTRSSVRASAIRRLSVPQTPMPHPRLRQRKRRADRADIMRS